MKRRQIIKAAGLGAMGLFLPLAPSAFGQAQNSAISSTQLAPELFLVKGAGANIVVHSGSTGLTLVDGGNAAMAEELITFLDEKFSSAKVSYLFNSHWHLDQTGANDLLAGTGTEIIAHENTRLWMGTEIISRWENDRIYPPRSKSAQPTNTFYYGSNTLNSNGAVMEYGHLPQAHTDGDIYVYFPEQNIMVGGGVISGGSYPLFDYSSGGWIGGVVTGLRTMLALTNEDTLYIPASGEVRNRADIEAQLEMCLAITIGIGENYYASGTYSEFLNSAPSKEFDQRWGDPDLFLATAYEGSHSHNGQMRRFR